MSGEPVTVVITRAVRAGREEAFEAAVRAWVPDALGFPGHLGVHMLRPPPGGREYGAVLKFASADAWAAFRDDPKYRAFLAAVREHLEAEPQVETVTGLESWFTPPGAAPVVPPRWKVALVSWAGVDLTALVLTYTLVPLTAGWPWVFQFLTFNAAVVAGLTWLVMPPLSRALRPWLGRPARPLDHQPADRTGRPPEPTQGRHDHDRRPHPPQR